MLSYHTAARECQILIKAVRGLRKKYGDDQISEHLVQSVINNTDINYYIETAVTFQPIRKRAHDGDNTSACMASQFTYTNNSF